MGHAGLHKFPSAEPTSEFALHTGPHRSSGVVCGVKCRRGCRWVSNETGCIQLAGESARPGPGTRIYSELVPLRKRVLGRQRAGLDQLKLRAVRDPGRHGGRKHRVSGLLRMALLGFCSGASTLREVEVLSEALEPGVREGLRIGHRVRAMSLRFVLVSKDPYELRRVNVDLIRPVSCSKSTRSARFLCGVVSIDGNSTVTPLVWDHLAESQYETVTRGAVRT
jgi:hypothetical protein